MTAITLLALASCTACAHAASAHADAEGFRWDRPIVFPQVEPESEGDATPQGDRAQPPRSEPHWSGLPVFGVEARDRGFAIPLPFGVGANVYSERQALSIDGLRLRSATGAVDLAPALNPSTVESRQSNTNLRLDAWLLPFVNVYGIFGYTEGESALELTVPPIPGLTPGQTVPVSLDYEGPTAGAGITLAGGGKPFEDYDLVVFGVADLNFTRTQLEFKNSDLESDSEIDATVLSHRLGARDTIAEDSVFGTVNAAVWAGAMYQDIAQTIVAGIPGSQLAVEIDQSPLNPWNGLVGGRLELGPHIEALIEVGFIERESIMLGLSARF
ncbi:MAG: hypothetical protein AAFU70_00750 [Planctomycetota bacterium]